MKPLSRLIDRVSHICIRRKDGVEYFITAAEVADFPGAVRSEEGRLEVSAGIREPEASPGRWDGIQVGGNPQHAAELGDPHGNGSCVTRRDCAEQMGAILRLGSRFLAAASGGAYLLVVQFRLLPQWAMDGIARWVSAKTSISRAVLSGVRWLLLAITVGALWGIFLGYEAVQRELRYRETTNSVLKSFNDMKDSEPSEAVKWLREAAKSGTRPRP